VINAIRKEDGDKASLLGMDYAAHLWMEKEIKTVANLVWIDVEEFLNLAARIPIRPEVAGISFRRGQHHAGGAEGEQNPGSKGIAVLSFDF